MIKTTNLCKKFRSNFALLDINLDIKEKLIVGMVGNNGAGKTTLINAIMGYIKPTTGFVNIYDKNPFDSPFIASNMILVDEKISYDPFLKLESIIKKYQDFVPGFDTPTCQRIIETFGLNKNRYYNKLSKGMKNQFNIAIGFACGREITIFDEPVAGLDELARDKFYDLILEEFDNKPRLFIVSTHLLAEMQNITNKLIVMRQGKIILYDDTENVGKKFANISGNYDRIAPLLVGRKVYNEEKLMNICSITVDNIFTRDEIKYMKEQEIDYTFAKANQACKIICNTEWVDKKSKKKEEL